MPSPSNIYNNSNQANLNLGNFFDQQLEQEFFPIDESGFFFWRFQFQ